MVPSSASEAALILASSASLAFLNSSKVLLMTSLSAFYALASSLAK